MLREGRAGTETCQVFFLRLPLEFDPADIFIFPWLYRRRTVAHTEAFRSRWCWYYV